MKKQDNEKRLLELEVTELELRNKYMKQMLKKKPPEILEIEMSLVKIEWLKILKKAAKSREKTQSKGYI